MDLLHALRLLALKAVVYPDKEYFVRKMIRWYSKTFFTPIAQVQDMPLEDILGAYFEEEFEQLDQEGREKLIQELLVTEEQRYQQMLLEDADEAEMFVMGQILAAEEKKKKLEAKKRKTEGLAPTPDAPKLIKQLPEADLPAPKPIKVIEPPPEGITMTFMSDEDLEAEMEGFGSMTQPKK